MSTWFDALTPDRDEPIFAETLAAWRNPEPDTTALTLVGAA